jgi:hypothetical protein
MDRRFKRALDVARYLFLAWRGVELGVSVVTGSAVALWSDVEPPFNYSIAVGFGLILFGLLTVLERRLREGWPPPWGTRHGPGTPGRAAAAVAAAPPPGLLITADPGTPGISQIVLQITETRNREVPVAPCRRLKAVAFTAPFGKTVRAKQLPRTVWWRGRRILTVKKFAVGAMTIDEHHALEIRAELFYEDD